MDGDSLRLVIGGALALVASLWILSSFFFRIGGIWILEVDDDTRQPETELHLAQMGPWVTGRRDVPGGVQEFSGFLIGSTLRLKRRDRGVDFLMDSGFPEAIARQVDGDISARLRLNLTDSGMRLEGEFIPNKVEFTHQPPRITSTYALTPVYRSFRRVTPELLPESEAIAEPTEPA